MVRKSGVRRKNKDSSVKDTNHESSDCRKRRKVVVEPRCAMKDKDVPVCVDYTLLLPEPTLHHILSCLGPKDAARASVLSKRWKQARDTCHVVEFDQRCFEGRFIDEFPKYVYHCLRRRFEQKYDIQIFKLALRNYHSELAADITRWIKFAVNHSVKEIDLHMQGGLHIHPFRIPSCVFAAKSLTAITLQGCAVGELDGLNLPNLRKLKLKRIRLTNDTLTKLISKCTSIEWLILVSCNGLVNLEVSTLEQLNKFEVHYCKGIRKIEIKAPKLNSFWFYRYKDPRRVAVNLVDCSSLKKLTLEDPLMDDLTFESLIHKFPYLEHLILSQCKALKKIKIFLMQLKSLVLRECNKLIGDEFHVPQLVSFEYSGACNMLFSLFNSSSLRRAKLQFGPYSASMDAVTCVQFRTKVLHFLSGIDQSSGLKLVVRHEKKIAVYQHWKHCKLIAMLPNMTFEIIKPSMTLGKLLDCLILTRPKTLSLVADEEWEKILHEKVINQVNQKDELSCCTYYPRKCWRHYLKGTSIEHSTYSVDIKDELNFWISLVEAEEPPSTTINLVWETQSASLP